jgi:hypothetical protein
MDSVLGHIKIYISSKKNSLSILDLMAMVLKAILVTIKGILTVPERSDILEQG